MKYSNGDLNKLQKLIIKFSKDRDWLKFHTLKNLAISLSLESNELLDHFQWLNDKEVEEVEKDKGKKQELAEEISDIFAYLLITAYKLDINLSEELLKKVKKNGKKYPKEDFQNLAWEEDNKRYQELRKIYLAKQKARGKI